MKITPTVNPASITINTTSRKKNDTVAKWWLAKNDHDLRDQLVGTANYLRDNQNGRHRQAAIHARLYSNKPLFNFVGSSTTKISDSLGLPTDRPTFNLIASASDTLHARITQSRSCPGVLNRQCRL